MKLHRRLSHAPSARIKATSECNDVTGLTYLGEHDRQKCDSCMRMTGKKASFKNYAYTRSTIPGERIHSDLKEVPVRSRTGKKWAVCFVDDCTRRGKTYGLRTKDETLDKWRQFLEEELLARGLTCRYFRSDNGGEYIGELRAFNNTRGIQPEYSPPHCQSGNGVAEVFWRETFKMVRTILWDQQRDHSWWLTALAFSNHIKNHLATTALPGQVPEAAFTKKPVDLRHFRVPLCDCWAYVEKKNRNGTLDHVRIKCIFIGYATNSPCYIVYDTDSGHVYHRRYEDVEFDERQKADPSTDPDAAWVQEILDQIELQMTQREKGEPTEVHSGFLRTTKDNTVADLATIFGMKPAEYLTYMQQYEGWYQKLNVESTVNKGSDIPVPMKVAEDHGPVHSAVPPQTTIVEQGPRTRAVPPKTTIDEQGPKAKVGPKSKATRRCAGTPRTVTARPESTSTTGVHARSSRPRSPRARSSRPMEEATRNGQQQDEPAESTSRGSRSTITRRNRKRKPKLHLESGIEVSLSKGVRRSARLREVAAALREINRDQYRINQLCAQSAREAALAAKAVSSDTPTQNATQTPADSTPLTTPKGYGAAHKGNHSEKWKSAEDKEWNGLWKRGTFRDEQYTGQRLHRLLWTYKVKADGTPKARLCIDGRQQDPSTYDNISSPTMRLTSFRTLLSVAAQNHWGIDADDATQAFVNAFRPEDKPLWASYPQGRRNHGRCLKVLRHLYGSHDAAMGWFDLLKDHLVNDHKMTQSRNDKCYFYRDDLHVVVHVDDLASTGPPAARAAFRKKLHAKFDMTGGEIDIYYGLNVIVTDGKVKLTAENYIEKAMEKLQLQPRSWRTPLDPNVELQRADKCTDAALHKRYRSLVGSVLHASTTCRPDVAVAARELASHLQTPTQQHVNAAIRTMQYLHATRKLGLVYTGTDDHSNTDFYGTCDASHNTTWNAKGITGWAYHLNGGAISWHCKAQPLTALSSTEAELIAVDSAVRELRHLHKLLAEFKLQVTMPTIIGQDNQSTIKLCESTHFNARTKHISLRYHHCGDQQRAGILKLEYLPTADIHAGSIYF